MMMRLDAQTGDLTFNDVKSPVVRDTADKLTVRNVTDGKRRLRLDGTISYDDVATVYRTTGPRSKGDGVFKDLTTGER